MSEPNDSTSARKQIGTDLRTISKLLHETDHLNSAARQELADLVEELSDALDAEEVSSEQLNHLHESTAHLVQAVHEQRESNVVLSARDRVEEAILAIETRSPTVAGLARRLVDALSNIGI